MLRLTGIPFRKAPGTEHRTAAPRLGEWGRNALDWPNWRVYIVHILGCGSGCMWVGSGRIRYVSGSSQCSPGLECSSSPTSGTVFPQSSAYLAADCGQIHIEWLLRGALFVGENSVMSPQAQGMIRTPSRCSSRCRLQTSWRLNHTSAESWLMALTTQVPNPG
jgi:hypothetical protein